tara:strand:+ start:702 stop:887 length:186 start_codon:yes stop_codon:yes gene_type:complete
MKSIIVELSNNPYWKNYGTVEIKTDNKNEYISFKTHQQNPIKYAKNLKEYKSGNYKLIIKN